MDLPTLPIKGERVGLRAPEMTDLDSIVRMATEPSVRRYLGGPRDAADVRAMAQGYLVRREADPYHPVIADSATGQMLGEVSLTRRERERPGHTRPEGEELELSYGLLPEAWGRGLAEEASRLLLTSFAERLPDEDVLVVTQAANTKSVALAERLGFTKVGTFSEFGAEQWLGVARLGAFGSR